MPFPSPGLRLIAVDMDGTLLDGEGRIPDALWPLLAHAGARHPSCRDRVFSPR